jgi:pyridoxine/pyridoxamine 5'-phosphate oxidase
VFYIAKSNYSQDSFILNTNYMTREKAQAWCNDNAAHLVSYNSSKEQAEVEGAVGAVALGRCWAACHTNPAGSAPCLGVRAPGDRL